MSEGDYTFADLPVPPIRPGTSVLLSGPTHAGTRQLAFRLLVGGDDEGTIVITTNARARRVIEDCRTAGLTVGPDRTAVVDCVGDGDDDLPARVVGVSGPADLTGVGMRYSKLYRTFHEAGLDRVRTGVCSVSTLLSFSDLQTVSRFVHTMVGRIDSVDGFGVFLIDPETQDARTVSTVGQFCGARIEVRDGDAGPELRTRGLVTGNGDWTPFDPRPGGP